MMAKRSRKIYQEKLDSNKLYFQGPLTRLGTFTDKSDSTSKGRRNFILPSMMTKLDKLQRKILRGK